MNAGSLIQMPDRATVNESYQLIRTLSDAEQREECVTLDMEEMTMFGPFGLALIGASVAARRLDGRSTRVALPQAPATRQFLEEVSFGRFVSGEDPHPGTLDLRQMSALDALYTQNVAELLVENVPGVTADNVYPIQLCLNELLQNVFEWSESRIGCVVLTRWYRQTKSVRLAVVDRGIGIPAALRRAQVRQLQRQDDGAVIEAAVSTPLLTSRANQVGGLGLKHIRDVVCGRAGRLTIVSLSAKVQWSGSKVSRFKSPLFRGTAIEIDVRPTASYLPIGQPTF